MNPGWMKQVFNYIYSNNKWNNRESISGNGSNLANTIALRSWLPGLLQELEVRVLLDIPCGDFYWMKEVLLNIDTYIGADIVEELVRLNQEKYGSSTPVERRFEIMDITGSRLPRADLIFCRDCLVHFSNTDVFRALENLRKSEAIYLLATTFTERQTNAEITTGQWRPLNLQADPFSLPEPLRLISEEYTGSRGHYPDKQMGLWEISSL